MVLNPELVLSKISNSLTHGLTLLNIWQLKKSVKMEVDTDEVEEGQFDPSYFDLQPYVKPTKK